MKLKLKLIKSKRMLLCAIPVILSTHAQAFAEPENQAQSLLTVSTSFASSFGDVSPTQVQVSAGQTASFTITPKPGFVIASIGGCNGSLTGKVYTTGAVSANCTVGVGFGYNPVQYQISTTSTYGGGLSPFRETVPGGGYASFQLNSKPGYKLQSISGCGGTLSGNTYTTGFINASCTISTVYLPGEKLVYLHTDVLGSTVLETDATGNVIKRTEYKPFGESSNN